MKNFIKYIKYFKSIFVKNGRNKGYIHMSAKIKGYSNIFLENNSYIKKMVKVVIENGNFILGENSYINDNSSIIIKAGTLSIGKNSFLNDNCNLIVLGDVKIGDDVMVAPMCSIVSGNHKFDNLDVNINKQGFESKNIIIEDNVWIGCNSIILGGVTIKKGSIIGAGSVVVKDIGENEIWAGNPAKFIRNR